MKIIKTDKYAQAENISKASLKNKIYKATHPITQGIFSDDSWVPVHEVFEKLRELGVDYSITSSDYGVSPSFQQTWPGENWKIPNDYKEWKFEIDFTNNRGRPDKLYGRIIASGAGSIDSPLDKYDLVCTVG